MGKSSGQVHEVEEKEEKRIIAELQDPDKAVLKVELELNTRRKGDEPVYEHKVTASPRLKTCSFTLPTINACIVHPLIDVF